MFTVTMILAVNKKGVIGDEGKLPWHLPLELKHFKEYTNGKVLLMGGNTFKGMGCKALPERFTLVLTNNTHRYPAMKRDSFKYINGEDKEVFSSKVMKKIPDKLLGIYDEEELVIVGGESVYEKALEMGIVDKVIYSLVDDDSVGDTKFMSVNEIKDNYDFYVDKLEHKEGFKVYTLINYNSVLNS